MNRLSSALAGTLAILASLTFAAPVRAGSTTLTTTGTSNQAGGGTLATGKLIAKPDDLAGATLLGDATLLETVSPISDSTIQVGASGVASDPDSSGLSTLPVMADFILMNAALDRSGGTEGANARFGGSFGRYLVGFASPGSATSSSLFAFLSLTMAGFFAVRRFVTRRIALT